MKKNQIVLTIAAFAFAIAGAFASSLDAPVFTLYGDDDGVCRPAQNLVGTGCSTSNNGAFCTVTITSTLETGKDAYDGAGCTVPIKKPS